MSKTVTCSPRTNRQTEPIVKIRGLPVYAFRLHMLGHPARSSFNHLSQSKKRLGRITQGALSQKNQIHMSKTVTCSPRTNQQTEPIVKIRGLYAFRLHLLGHPARSSFNHLSQSNFYLYAKSTFKVHSCFH